MRRTLATLAVSLLVASLAVIGAPAQLPAAGGQVAAVAGRGQGQGGTPEPAPRPRLALSAQTPVVGAGGAFTMRVRVDRNALPASAELAVTVYGAVHTRSEFEQTVQDRISRPALTAPVYAVSNLAVDAAGDTTISIPVMGPNEPDPTRLDLGTDNNVFPVRVELRDRNGPVMDRLTTHLVHIPIPPTGPKLGVSFVLPFAAGIGLPADGPRGLAALDSLAAAAQALDATRALPFVLAPSPETIGTLADLNEEQAERALDALRRVAAERPVAAQPYVPVHLPTLLEAGLDDEVGAQLATGTEVVTEELQARPDGRLWVANDPLDPASVDELATRGVIRMVVPEALLEPVPNQTVTLTRPFLVEGAEQEVAGIAADPGLGGYFNDSPNQALQAYHLLADLAVLWLDAPGDDRRAVLAMPGRDWKANRAFMEALAGGLAQHAVAEPLPVDVLFSSVEPAYTGRGTPLVRDLADLPPAAGFPEVVATLRQTRGQLSSLRTVTGEPTPALLLLEQRLLIAQSSELETQRRRNAYLDAVETGIADQLDDIDMPEGRSITLTARRGQIPVTFQNRTGTPVHVVVTVESDKLEFPEGTSRPIELTRRNTTERFSVVARTSGAFPLRITLVSPDGNLVVGQARLTVRSTAASRVSLFVSLGAALFLMIWWGRHVVRGRRAGRLVPS